MSNAQESSVPQFQRHHRLSLALEQADVKVPEMASILGVTPATVYNYMSGERGPKLAAVKIWAMRCRVPWQWIEYGTTPPTTDGGGGPASTIWYKTDSRPRLVAIAS